MAVTPRSEVWRGPASSVCKDTAPPAPAPGLSSLGAGAGAARPHAHLPALHCPLVAGSGSQSSPLSCHLEQSLGEPPGGTRMGGGHPDGGATGWGGGHDASTEPGNSLQVAGL